MKILVYGTLRVGQGAYQTFGLDKSTVHLGQVRIPGSMYHLGGFPGVVLDGNEEGVLCDVLEITDAAAVPEVVRSLDAYEGYRETSPYNSLYLRREVEAGQFGQASIYEINRDMGGRSRITGGDWVERDAA
jgi:gamma-glutamylcyclotransferase (GGCT)/AIG2-like uncharacterized protein YtfP